MTDNDASYIEKPKPFIEYMACPSCKGKGFIGQFVKRPCLDCRAKGRLPVMDQDGRWSKREVKGGFKRGL